ncbi:MAG TPA: ABATE domain-containing protein, partial [Dongiaceae bacterium]
MVRSNPMAGYGSYLHQRPKFIAGARCLDFLNTREEGGTERLTGYAEFAIWAKAAGLTDAAGLRRLLALAAEQPHAAAKELALVLEMRQALSDLLSGAPARRGAAELAVNRILARDRFVLQVGAGK